MSLTRPVVRYHGGKWKLAEWLTSFFPSHRVYVEPFGGGGSVLLRKPRSYTEVYNDLDGDAVNLFRVLRDPQSSEALRQAVMLTPFSRAEFKLSYERVEDPVERARRSVIRSFMGFGSAAMSRDHKTGFRSNSNRSGTTPARDWVNWPESISVFTERLRGVVIEQKQAAALIPQHDTPLTLFYCDPPYVFASRSFPRGASQPFCYRHEMTDEDHRALAAVLHGVTGMVVLSGYASDLYDLELYTGWERHERDAHADGASDRVEVVWLNAACAKARSTSQQQLFATDTASRPARTGERV